MNLRFHRQTLTSLLLFCFPLAGNSVRSWTGAFFVALLLWALSVRPWREATLSRLERNALSVLIAIFIWVILSASVNGWSELDTRGLGVHIRYLAVIPIYFLIKANLSSLLPFMLGCVVGSFVLAAQGIQEVFYLSADRAYGVYGSPGLFAGHAVVFGIFSALLVHLNRERPWLMVLGVLGLISAFLCIVLAGSRSTYFVLAIFLFVGLPLLLLGRRISMLLYFAFVSTVVALSYNLSSVMKQQVHRGVDEVRIYLSDPDPLRSSSHGSVGTRLEMWRASLIIARDYWLTGVGWRAFPESARSYAERGEINPLATHHPHPHNTYLEFLVSYGLIGLGLLLAFYVYGFLVPDLWLRVLLMFWLLNGIHEGGLFVYGNSLSFLLVAWAVMRLRSAKLGNASSA